LPHGGRVCRRPSFEKPDYVSSQAFLFYTGLERRRGQWQLAFLHDIYCITVKYRDETLHRKGQWQLAFLHDTYRIAVKYPYKRCTTKKQKSKTTKKHSSKTLYLLFIPYNLALETHYYQMCFFYLIFLHYS
ncbi:hypothetical protein, partial [Myroides odoratus]|uniref:hypothetical protein n=1 Tax=Myroides odoratus TaxID=256 RepID=UPI002166CD6A